MKKIISLCTSALLALGLGVVGVSAASAVETPALVGTVGSLESWSSEKNAVSYWENRFSEHEATCYLNTHGSITDDGKTVTLGAFNQSWPGDHWEALIVKGGSVSVNVVTHPSAGVAYASPLNSGGQQSDVSWRIACKGTTPEPETKVEEGEWVTGEYECDDTEVTETREVSTTTYALVDGEWVGTTEVTTEERTRALTDEEIAELDCQLPTPTPLPEEPERLATTGADSEGIAGLGLSALAALLLGAGVLTARRLARR